MRRILTDPKMKGLAALVAGLFAALGQVPWSLWPLGLLGFAMAVWLVRDAANLRAAILRAWAFGFGHFFLTLHWITQPFQVEAERDAWMAPFAWVLMAAGLALFWLLAGALSRLAQPRLRGVAFALALLAMESLRSVIFTGFPWALPGHIWLDHAPAQLASVLGAGGLGLLTMGLALAAQRRKTALLGAVALAAIWGWGGWRESGDTLLDGPIVRLVQPNADQALKWDPQYARMFFERHLDLSLTPSTVKPSLVLWPETSVPFWLDDDGGGLALMSEVLGDLPVAFGIQRGEGMRAFNSLAVLGRDSGGAPEIQHVYDKHQLVPFGEYIPMGDVLADWIGIFSFSPAHGAGYSAGAGPQVFDLGALGKVQPLICYEAVFPWFPRAVDRPDWLMQVTNDAWFGTWAGPYQHLSLTRLRAIENGLPLLRVANTGVSAVIDGRGHVLQSLDMGVEGVIDSQIPQALPATLYTKFGGLFAFLIWVLGFFTFLARNRVKD